MTDAKSMMCSTGLTAATDAVASYVQDGRIVHIDEVRQHLRAVGYGNQPNAIVEKALKAASYVKRRRANPKGSGQIALWVPDSSARSRGLNSMEMTRLERVGAFD
ncbi:hypothetical protein CDL60_26215 [Roseateles noduli]|nr:hypothetical protein CDL60_26215 [Roseateles noduli]